jgi:hypothetical protein
MPDVAKHNQCALAITLDLISRKGEKLSKEMSRL